MKLILDSNKRWTHVHVPVCVSFRRFFCQASGSTHLWGYVCVLKTFDKNLKSLLKHYDKIMFSCLNANSCGHVVSLCLMVLWFCLSVSNKQWLVSQSCFLPLCPFATTSELLKISAAFMANEDCLIFSQERRKTMSLRKDEWAAITCGEFLIFCTTSTSHTQIRRLLSRLVCYR